jgi:CheY-like chemotaxis protein
MATVLIADDEPSEFFLMQRSFEKARLVCDLRYVKDGQETMDYLLRRGAYHDPQSSPRPDLVLLDLNMPKLHGCEVLDRIKSDPRLASLPVVVLTTSDQEYDVRACYEMGCNNYLTKPVEVTDFIDMVHGCGPYWLKLVVLPQAQVAPQA